MFPTREKALEILLDAEKSNPGMWVNHSFLVAQCAEKIADKCSMDVNKAYVLGLLHDIGRKFGIGYFTHVVYGYNYMSKLGYDDAARICLTHSFSTKCIDDYVGEFDISDGEKTNFADILENVNYDDYDRLIQLCDCLAGGEGIIDMGSRMDDVERRYGKYPQNKRIENFKLKDYFEEKTGEKIYKLITDNQELWDL